MNKVWYWPLFVFITVMCTSVPEREKELVFIKPEEKEAGVYFFNIHDHIYFEVDGNTGGRISSFRIGEKEMLSGKQVDAESWGSTFWTSPQKDWGKTPSANIDKNKYQGEIKGDTIVLISDKDEKLGYTVEKKFFANAYDSSVIIIYKVINNSDKKRKVAPWEVTRVSHDGLTLFPSATGKKGGSLAPMMYDEDGITYFEFEAKRIPKGASKLVGESSEGWMAYIHDRVALIKKFGDVSADKIAPQEGEIELFANPDKAYMEIDEQGEYAELKPGQFLEWEVRWYLKKLPDQIKAEKGNKRLINYIRNVVK